MKNLKINPFYLFITLFILLVFKSNVYAYPTDVLKNADETRDLFVIETEAAPVFKSHNISYEDIYLMAQVVYGESRGEDFKGKVAVASVILNRLVSGKFPDSIDGIIYETNAFSCIKTKNKLKPDKSSYEAVYKAISGEDPTMGCTFFYNPETSSSSWINKVNKKDAVKIGNHLFFKT